MTKSATNLLCVLLLSLHAHVIQAAELAFASVFQEGMILQRELPLRIWGTGLPGEVIEISCGSESIESEVSEDGRWLVELPGQDSRVPTRLELSNSSQDIVIENVRFGEVWLCSGQSNMQWATSRSDGWSEEKAFVHNTNLMLFYAPAVVAAFPIQSTEGQWKVSNVGPAAQFSAVGYYFGKKIQAELGVPVGVISASQGGTNAIAWVDRDATYMLPELQHYWGAYERALASQRQLYKDWVAKLEKWFQNKEKSLMPWAPMGMGNFNTPAGLYNGTIAPFAPMTLRGIIWYQGEANSTLAEEYKTLFPALIKDWRRKFRNQDLPFYFAQLASFERGGADDYTFADLRSAQEYTLKNVDHTGMVVLIDAGARNDIHPKNKKLVGERFARQVISKVYRGEGTLSGPMFLASEMIGNKISVSFDYSSGLCLAEGTKLKSFELSYDGRNFQPANARLVGQTVEVELEGRRRPVELRYAWANWPESKPNLTNATGLAALPFKVNFGE